MDFDLRITARRLLKDSEIIDAIKRKLIVLDDPDVYLKERRDDLIQPASMDLLLRSAGCVYPMYEIEHAKLDYCFPVPVHKDVDDRFVTFWPGYQTEATVRHFKWHNENLRACPELRSTLRRVGLDIGYNFEGRMGFDEDQFGFLNIRNPQKYPVSVEKGEKIAQVIWKDRGIKYAPNGFEIVERKLKHGSGRMITSRNELIALIEQGDIYQSGESSVGDSGVLLFHAGRVKNYYNNGPVIISKSGVTGFNVSTQESCNHIIHPGEFSDIETIERIGLSKRVAMQVFYTSKPVADARNRKELINSYNTFDSTGGWIDPGYGMDKKDGAPFSVQRKAFTESIRIRQGELVGYGVIWFFPEPVEKAYSKERGSHYNEARGFVGPRI